MQSTFTSGQVNPALKARTDIQHYYDGLLQADNVDIKPQGGAKVRGGLRYLAQALELNARLVPFIFNETDKYLLVFSDLKMQVFKAGVLQTNLNGSGNDFITTPYTTAQCDELDFTQSYNTMILFHQDVAPRLLFRGNADDVWTLSTPTFEDIPQVDYDDASSPTPTTHDIQITFTGTWSEADHYKLDLDGFETSEIVYSADTDANERRIQEALLKLPPTGFRKSGITVTHQSGLIYRIQFSGDSADNYEPMAGYNSDVAASKITESTRTTEGVSRREDAFSAGRGYPACGGFYEGRLWMAGFKSLPQHEMGSVVNDIFSLKIGDGFDDEAIFQPIDTDQYNGIKYLHPGRHLAPFTAGGEFFHPGRPITPSNSGRPRQTKYGIGRVKPTEIDGAAIFVTKSNKTVREFIFAQLEEAYNAPSLSLLAADPLLSSEIYSMDSQSGAEADETSQVFCVTGDGNCAVLATLRSQEIAAWSRYTTEGDFKRVAVVDDEIYFLVHRTINSVVVPYLEQIDATIRMDSAITGTQASSTTISGLTHLEAATVRVIGDDLLLGSETVASAAITADRTVEDYQVGLDFNPSIQALPLNVDLGDGPLIGLTKSVPDLYVVVQETNGLLAEFDASNNSTDLDVQEQEDPQWIIDQQAMDSPPSVISGVRHFEFTGSTEGDALIRLYQRDPLPYHILGFVAVVDIGGQ